MQILPFPALVGPSYTYGSLPIDCQLSINWESVPIASPAAKTKFALYSTPGFVHKQFRLGTTIYQSLPTAFPGRIRGMYYTSKGFFGSTARALVVVAAESVWEVKPADNLGIHDIRKIGVVSNLNGQVTMVDDGYGLIISDNLTLYRVVLETSVMTSLGTDAPLQASSVTFLGSYTICCGSYAGVAQQSYFFSKPEDNSSWDALNYASAEGSADPLTTVKAVGGDLWLLAPSSYEVHSQTGSYKKPFTRVAGSLGAIGSASPGAVATLADQIFFLGSGEAGNYKAYASKGYNVVPISTDALEQEWATYSSFSDCIGYTYSMGGLSYWVLTWLSDDTTYVYNLESNTWHQRLTRDASTDSYHRWKITEGVFAYDRIIVGDLEGTMLYDLSRDYLDEDGNPIVRCRRSPHVTNGQSVSMHRYFTLDVETGIGISSGQGSDPQIMMRYSSDGARTWSAERWKTAGRMGAYKTRCKWEKLGIARDRVYEIYCSDPVKWTILGAEIAIENSVAGI